MTAGASIAPADTADARSLRERLIGVGLELLDEEGIEAISLRAIARRAGVSHGAPLRHFRSLADLLAEVAAHGFRILEASIRTAAAELEPGAGPVARLHAAGRAYVVTAVEHASLFRLMFRPDTIDTDNPRFEADSSAAFDRLLGLVRAVQDAGWCSDRDTRLLAGVVWAQVHGIADLWASRAFQGPVPDAGLDETIELHLELALPTRGATPSSAFAGANR